MSAIKEFGFKVAKMLFEQNYSVEDVVDALAIQTVEKDGELVRVELDREWLTEQVKAVKKNRRTWGYSYRWELSGQRKHESRAPIPAYLREERKRNENR